MFFLQAFMQVFNWRTNNVSQQFVKLVSFQNKIQFLPLMPIVRRQETHLRTKLHIL